MNAMSKKLSQSSVTDISSEVLHMFAFPELWAMNISGITIPMEENGMGMPSSMLIVGTKSI